MFENFAEISKSKSSFGGLLSDLVEDINELGAARQSAMSQLGGLGQAIAKLVGYDLTCEALILDIDQPDGQDGLSSVYGS